MIIKRLLRQDIMKESVIYQEIQEIGEAQGIQKGEAKIILRLLHRRLGEIPDNFKQQIRELSVKQLENLGEALLDFETQADLLNWLHQAT